MVVGIFLESRVLGTPNTMAMVSANAFEGRAGNHGQSIDWVKVNANFKRVGNTQANSKPAAEFQGFTKPQPISRRRDGFTPSLVGKLVHSW